MCRVTAEKDCLVKGGSVGTRTNDVSTLILLPRRRCVRWAGDRCGGTARTESSEKLPARSWWSSAEAGVGTWHEGVPIRLPKARRPNGESSEIRSRALNVRRNAFMVESFEYKQEKNVYAMSACSD
jgi:hypothetical protein